MNNISKNLKNVMKINGRKEKLNEFISRLEKEVCINKIDIPDGRLNKIKSEYIDKHWDNNVNLEKSVLIGTKGRSIILIYSNQDFEYFILEQIKKLELNADFTYLNEDNNTGVVVREFCRNGEFLRGYDYESKVFDISKYNLTMCFQNLYPIKT